MRTLGTTAHRKRLPRACGHQVTIGKGTVRTVRAVFPRRALQSVVSTSGLARQAVGLMHLEQPKVSEEGIRPLLMIA